MLRTQLFLKTLRDRKEVNYNKVSDMSPVVLQLSKKTSEEDRRGLCSDEQTLVVCQRPEPGQPGQCEWVQLPRL